MNKKFLLAPFFLVILLTLSFVSTGSADENGTCVITVEDEAVPSRKLRVNSWVLGIDEEGNYVWQTNSPEGVGPKKEYTIEDTKGCNCEQILGWLRDNYPEKYGEMKGHYKFGCSISVMEEFISAVPSVECVPGETMDCDTALLGVCAAGTRTCTAEGYWGECVQEAFPSDETCDALDNDCDGTIDEDLIRSCYTGEEGTEGVGVCTAGTQTCTSGSWGDCVGEVTPSEEDCYNGLDDDCDTRVDDDDEDCFGWG